jgi:hypothetical protein
MFSGVGILLNGNLLVGVRKDSLLVRLGPEAGEEALKEAHVGECQQRSESGTKARGGPGHSASGGSRDWRIS